MTGVLQAPLKLKKSRKISTNLYMSYMTVDKLSQVT